MIYEANTAYELDSYVNGFTFMTKDELCAFIDKHTLSFSIDQALYIQSYFKNQKKMYPTYNQIYLFDAINKARKALKSDYSIYSATSAESGAEAILEASKDLLSKSSVCKKRGFGAMPISFAASVASSYLKYIGLAEGNDAFEPTAKAPLSSYYIHTNDDIPLFAFSDANAPKQDETLNIPHYNALVMLCPMTDISYDEYNARALEFLSAPEISSVVAEHTTVSSEYGIFNILIKERQGVFVNLSNIPEVEKNENGKVVSLISLLSSCIGRHIFTTNYASAPIINRIASAYSLSAIVFAVRNDSRMMTLEAIKNPSFTFDFDFLQALMNFKDHREYIFSNENNQPLGSRQSVFLTDNRADVRQTHRAEKILNFGKVMASATSRSLISAPHKTASIAVLDAITSLAAKGISKNSITLFIAYSLLGSTDDPLELGKNLAAILGAYRSMTELCVADAERVISYDSKKRDITVLAVAPPPIRKIKSSFGEYGTYIYFLPYQYDESGMPDYNEYRESLSFYYSLIEKDNVLSAFAINENLFTILENADLSSSFKPYAELDRSSLCLAHGILFESDVQLSYQNGLLFLGGTQKSDATE